MEEVPFEDRRVPLAEVEWNRSAWWWYPITRSVQPAIKMFSLAVSLIAILLAQLGLRLAESLFQPDRLPAASVATPVDEIALLAPLRSLAVQLSGFEEFGLNEVAYLSFTLLWLTATFALLGGVLARRAVVELGQRTVAPWIETVRTVFSRTHSYLWSTGMHMVAVVSLALPFVGLGFISRFGNIASVIAGILLLCCFPLVFAIGRFALSAVVCFPLSVCAISVERKADAFEGFSRSNAYFYQRPVVTVGCYLILATLGYIGQQIVFWTLTAGWFVTEQSFLLAAGELTNFSQRYVNYGGWLTESLISAYWFSFFWAATAATYLIVRRSVDGTELDDIDTSENSFTQSLPEIPPSPAAPTKTENEDEAQPGKTSEA